MSFHRARPGFPAVFAGDLVSVSEMRARLAARRSRPYPSAPVLAPRPASAPLSAHSASEPRRPDPDVPLRPDLAVVRGTRRGGREAAMTASASLEGTALALADLRRDRHAASCKASRQSLLNTWFSFHAAALEMMGSAIPRQALPLTPIGLDFVASYFKAGGLSEL